MTAIAGQVRECDGVADVHESIVALLETHRAELPPETVAVLDQNLRSIDRAIAEIHLALESNPEHQALGFLLAEAYRSEAELLERLEWWLETINESIELEGQAIRVDARTINGSIKLTGVSEEVSASTISGSIQVNAGTLQRADLKTPSGSIELATRFADRARANLKSFSGSIRLDLPSDTSARFDVQSFSGGIRNELTTSSTHSGPRVGGQHREFTTAEGDGRVEIESFSGSVEIHVDD